MPESIHGKGNKSRDAGVLVDTSDYLMFNNDSSNNYDKQINKIVDGMVHSPDLTASKKYGQA